MANGTNRTHPKFQKVLESIHEAMLNRKKRAGVKAVNSIILENRIFAVVYTDFEISPTKCARILNHEYGYDLFGDDVIALFRGRRLANPHERKDLFRLAYDVARNFGAAAQGDEKAFQRYERKRKELGQKCGGHKSWDRIIAVMIYEKYPEMNALNDKENMQYLGDTLSKAIVDDISDILCDVYGYSMDSGKVRSRKELSISLEEAERMINRLEHKLERTDLMLKDLQDEFDEQLEASKISEMTDFFARLNSEKYGFILDELLLSRRGIAELRKQNYELPLEINGLIIMVKKLIQFVKDNHIDPIMKVDALEEVTAADIEFCNYEGSPFSSPEEKKIVRVISPGWIYKDKEIQISRPRVKEENEC